jgi:sulfhydrogenase subunit delta
MIKFADPTPTIAIHKFTSCDGCQLSLLNMGADLITLSEKINIKHFVEAGIVSPHAQVDIAFIEGSISTQSEVERIQEIRKSSRYIVALGACATAGGIQALRNHHDGDDWLAELYPDTSQIDNLATSRPVEAVIRTDFEIRGCPVTGRQLTHFLLQLIQGLKPNPVDQSVCMTCKQKNISCVMVTKKIPCLGPITQTGCGALCSSYHRGCFGCYGQVSQANIASLVSQFTRMGLSEKTIKNTLSQINQFEDKTSG